jgi:mRNA interferase HigB
MGKGRHGKRREAGLTCRVVANNRIVFNVKGNDYRLIAAVHYIRGMKFIRFVGTHREYDKIDAGTI